MQQIFFDIKKFAIYVPCATLSLVWQAKVLLTAVKR